MAGERITITVAHTVDVARPPEAVWDYTQDFARRAAWDRGVVSAQLIAEAPRRARLELRGIGPVTAEYRLDRRPERTSLAFTETRSRWITGGGGYWEYELIPGGTRWTQRNTLVLRPGLLSRLVMPLLRAQLAAATRGSMGAAKRALESMEA